VIRSVAGVALVIVLVALAGCATPGAPRARITSPFGALTSAEGSARAYGPHNGIDLAAGPGTPVIAPADGVVTSIGEDGPCGTMLVVTHESFGTPGFFTRYCHLSVVQAAYKQPVRRGQQIALTGTSGQTPGIGFEHLHFELRLDSAPIDPVPHIVGCFDPSKAYPTDRLALTYPLRC